MTDDDIIEPHGTIRLTLYPCEDIELPGERAVTVRLEIAEALSVYRSLRQLLGNAA